MLLLNDICRRLKEILDMIGNISKDAVVESSSDGGGGGKRRRRKSKRRKELPSIDESVQLESSTAASSTNPFEIDNGDEENNDHNVPSASVNNPTSAVQTPSLNPFEDEDISNQGAFITYVSFLSYQL